MTSVSVSGVRSSACTLFILLNTSHSFRDDFQVAADGFQNTGSPMTQSPWASTSGADDWDEQHVVIFYRGG